MVHRTTAIASFGIELSLQGRSFHTSEIIKKFEMKYSGQKSEKPPSRSTVYRVLCQLEEEDWIEQRGNNWFPNVKSQMLEREDESTSNQASSDFQIEIDDIL